MGSLESTCLILRGLVAQADDLLEVRLRHLAGLVRAILLNGELILIDVSCLRGGSGDSHGIRFAHIFNRVFVC